jgi:hypothetical protein
MLSFGPLRSLVGTKVVQIKQTRIQRPLFCLQKRPGTHQAEVAIVLMMTYVSLSYPLFCSPDASLVLRNEAFF